MSTRKEERQEKKAQKRAGKQEKRTQRRAEGKGFGQQLKRFGLPLVSGVIDIAAKQLGISPVVSTITKQVFNMANLTKAVTGSPKSTAAGITGFIALLATQAEVMFDGDPLTIVNWPIIINAVIVLVMGLIIKDGDVSSKSIGLEDEK